MFHCQYITWDYSAIGKAFDQEQPLADADVMVLVTFKQQLYKEPS